MKSQYNIFLGDYLPNFVRPLVTVAATTINTSLTVLEIYILVPGSGDQKKQLIGERRNYKIDLNSIPSTVISFETIFQDGVDFSESKIDVEFYQNIEWHKRSMLLSNGRYTLHKAENHLLFRYKWSYGFQQELKKIFDITSCQDLKDYLTLVNKVDLPPPDVTDPFSIR